MKVFHCIVFATTSFFATQAACAQEREVSEAPTAEQRLAEDIGVEKLGNLLPVLPVLNVQNAALLLQNGSRNVAEVAQRNTGLLPNGAFIQQIGDDNTLTLNQSGSQNSTRFTQTGNGNRSMLSQDGFNNSLTGLVDGNRNEVNAVQQGNDNRIVGEIHEDDKKYTIGQYGNGNTLTQFESTNQRKGYNVEMRGNGINITIEQSNVLPGLR